MAKAKNAKRQEREQEFWTLEIHIQALNEALQSEQSISSEWLEVKKFHRVQTVLLSNVSPYILGIVSGYSKPPLVSSYTQL